MLVISQKELLIISNQMWLTTLTKYHTRRKNKTMTLKRYKYIVRIEGFKDPLEYRFLEDALQAIKLMMPCKAAIEAKEK